MGLLDDAIREHLDLKRQRGADPTEVDQLERDALGPVRRGPQVSDEPLPDEEHHEHFDNGDHLEHNEHLERDEAFDNHGPLGAEEPFDEQHPPEREGSAGMLYDDQADETLERPARPAAPPERGVAEEPDREERSWSYDTTEEWEGDKPAERAPAPTESAEARPPAEARRPEAPPEPAEHAGQETVEYDVEAEHQRGEKDDPLEETPEFLQDTPDHDRLWFEQRPPRPFDFDK